MRFLLKLRQNIVRPKVLIDLFQKVAGSKDGVLGRPPQRSKHPGVRSDSSLFGSFSLFKKEEKKNRDALVSKIL